MIYFVRCCEFVKIGVAVDPIARLLTLQTGCPFDMQLIGVAPGKDKEETELHRLFMQDHYRGEWFVWTKQIEQYVEKECDKSVACATGIMALPHPNSLRPIPRYDPTPQPAQQALNPNELLTNDQAAALVGLKPQTLQNWRMTGKYNLPYIRVGRLIRYRRADVMNWLASRRGNADGAVKLNGTPHFV